MFLSDSYVGDWHLQLNDQYHNSMRWRVISPKQPTIAELAAAQSCVMHQRIADYQWLCATKRGLWMLHYEQQQWWLTLWSTQPTSGTKHRLGQVISHHQTELYELLVIDSKYSAQQLMHYSKFKWGQRQPLVREIQHGQFHLQLQQPPEDYFILQLHDSSLLLQFRNRRQTARSGNR